MPLVLSNVISCNAHPRSFFCMLPCDNVVQSQVKKAGPPLVPRDNYCDKLDPILKATGVPFRITTNVQLYNLQARFKEGVKIYMYICACVRACVCVNYCEEHVIQIGCCHKFGLIRGNMRLCVMVKTGVHKPLCVTKDMVEVASRE